MKLNHYIFIFFTFFLFSLSGTAQEMKGEQIKLKASDLENLAQQVYGQDALEQIGPANQTFFENIIKNRITISKLDQNPSHYINLEELAYNNELVDQENFDPKDFNPFNYKLDYYNQKQDSYYKMYDTDYFVILKKDQAL